MAVKRIATKSRYIGLSTDAKPISVPVGSTFYEYDTSHRYVAYGNILTNGDFETGDPPTGWTAYNSTPTQEGTTIKTGSYSIKITCNGAWAEIYQAIDNYAYYKGRKVTFGAWVLADSGNNKNQVLAIVDGVGGSSTAIDKDDTWHWVTVTRTINASATKVELSLVANNSAVSDTDDILYGDGAIFEGWTREIK